MRHIVKPAFLRAGLALLLTGLAWSSVANARLLAFSHEGDHTLLTNCKNFEGACNCCNGEWMNCPDAHPFVCGFPSNGCAVHSGHKCSNQSGPDQ
jgi:hypothetical protein